MKGNLESKGITLIALVITIIVLLILAGVSIAMLTGNNGILTKAQESKEETRAGAVEEARNLWNQDKELDNRTNASTAQTLDELLQSLEEQHLLTADEVQIIKDTGSIKIGKRTIEFGKMGKTLVQAFKDGEIKIGDYITDYNNNLNNPSASVELVEEETGHAGIQKYQVDTNTTWRILGISQDETQLIITTGSPIKKVMNNDTNAEEWEKDPYLYLNSAEGWYNTNDELTNENILDKICKIYDSNLAEETKSMRIEDINNVLGLTLDKDNNKLYKTSDVSKTAIQEYQGFFGQTYTYKKWDYAPENYLKEKYSGNNKYQSLETKKIGSQVEGSAFMYQYISSNVVDQNSKLYDILFKGTTTEKNNAKAYWLASPGVLMGGTSFCSFGPGAVVAGDAGPGYGLFASDGDSYELWLAVRPVVYLKSNITVDELTINENGSEEIWNTSVPNSYTGESLEYGQIEN